MKENLIKEFGEKLLPLLELEDVKEVKVVTLDKINKSYVGLSINVLGYGGPVYDLTPYYNSYMEGKGLREIAEEIKNCFENLNGKYPMISEEEIEDPEWMLERTTLELVSKEKNREALNEVPFIEKLEYAVIPRVTLKRNPDGSEMTVVLTNSMMENLGLTRDEVFEVGMTNTIRRKPLELESILSYLPIDYPEESKPLYVVTTKDRERGSISLFYPGTLERIREKVGNEFYIIPSSIHEMLVISPDEMTDEKEFSSTLTRMVKDVNETVVIPEEVLGYTVFHYINGEITACKDVIQDNAMERRAG